MGVAYAKYFWHYAPLTYMQLYLGPTNFQSLDTPLTMAIAANSVCVAFLLRRLIFQVCCIYIFTVHVLLCKNGQVKT